MRRYIALLILIFLLASLLTETNSTGSSNELDPLANARSNPAGKWLDTNERLYLLYGTTVTFDYKIASEEKKEWIALLQTSIELLPPNLRDELDGLLVSFNTGNTCVEDNYLGCFNSRSFSIYISTQKLNAPLDLMSVTLHELGHAIDHRLAPGRAMFQGLRQNRSFPTAYARTSATEDFAESFFVYIMYPEYLKECCTARYRFLQNNVFNGVEYKNRYPLTPFLKRKLSQ
ncbi:MAG: hypothetical protein Q8P37_00350 [Candidatus Spechtbacteria bacterium]|nr:hypothetical protein [Candidatus Spechtbacteria bacterium]